MVKTITALFLLLVASVWTAFVNGQPFFMADTTAYVRGPDFAAVYLLGDKFASAWTQKRNLAVTVSSVAPPGTDAEVLNSPLEKKVLAGRSIFYGALLYIGHITSYFWLSIAIQAAVFLYLTHTFLVRCCRLSFSAFAFIVLVLLAATPISFFNSFLMPDVFASFLILAVIILATFWRTLHLHDRLLLSGIALYSSLVHVSHLLLLLCLTVTASLVSLYLRNRTSTERSPITPVGILAAMALVAIFGELAFSYTVQATLGVKPVRPPYVTARLIADGPGYQFLQQNCADGHYTICAYLDRLPVHSDTFLWSANPKEGVFVASNQETRIALASEQPRFIFNVFRFDPIGVVLSAVKNCITQLFDIGLMEFFPTHADLEASQQKIPSYYFEGLLNSRLSANGSIERPATLWFSSLYFAALISLVAIGCLRPWMPVEIKEHFLPIPQWSMAITLSISAMVFNAAICGALSGPHPRYQTRISWIPILILLLLAAKYWKHILPAKKDYKLSTP